MSIRHAGANGLYALGSVVATTTGRLAAGGDSNTWGDKPYEPAKADETTSSTSIHLRNGEGIWADFRPGSFTYAALHVGRGGTATIFLSRQTTHKLLNVLQFVERQYAEYGEGRTY